MKLVSGGNRQGFEKLLQLIVDNLRLKLLLI